jgi:hypothetical protein
VSENRRAPPAQSGTSNALNTLGAACGALVTPVGSRAAPRDARVARLRRRGQTWSRGSVPSACGGGRPRDTASPRPAPPREPRRRGSASGWRSTGSAASARWRSSSCWFRLIDVAVKSSGFTFGTVLAVYLAGCGVGTLLGTRLLARSARPAPRLPDVPGRHPLVCRCRRRSCWSRSRRRRRSSRGSSTCGAGGARTTWAAPGSGGLSFACTRCCPWRSTARRRC